MTGAARDLPPWLDVSRETVGQLSAFLDLVIKWNPKINLVSAGSLPNAWTRHVLDSVQLWNLVRPAGGIWLDVGSGGGFPGIVMSIMAREACPDLRVILVESDRRKAVFLGEALRQLQLNAVVHCARIENLEPLGANVVSARALASMDALMPMVSRHMASGGVAVFPKGQRYQSELDLCQKDWIMQVETFPSKTDPEAAVVKIWDLKHA